MQRNIFGGIGDAIDGICQIYGFTAGQITIVKHDPAIFSGQDAEAVDQRHQKAIKAADLEHQAKYRSAVNRFEGCNNKIEERKGEGYCLLFFSGRVQTEQGPPHFLKQQPMVGWFDERAFLAGRTNERPNSRTAGLSAKQAAIKILRYIDMPKTPQYAQIMRRVFGLRSSDILSVIHPYLGE